MEGAAPGDRARHRGLAALHEAGGAAESSDGGVTWHTLSLAFMVNDLAVDPVRPQTSMRSVTRFFGSRARKAFARVQRSSAQAAVATVARAGYRSKVDSASPTCRERSPRCASIHGTIKRFT
jgi:hypothetical protein